jgi:hypothetical protein
MCRNRVVTVFARYGEAAFASDDDQPVLNQTLHSGLYGVLAIVALCTVTPAIMPAVTGGGGGGSIFSHGFGGGGGGFFHSLLPIAHAGAPRFVSVITHCTKTQP